MNESLGRFSLSGKISSCTLLPACPQPAAAWHWGRARPGRDLCRRAAIHCRVFQTFLASLAYDFSPPSAPESRKGFPCLRPSSIWKPAVPADDREGEGCRGTQQAPPARSAHLHPGYCVAAGSDQAVLPTTVLGLAGLAGTGGSSSPLTKCFRPRSQNDFDILGKERNLTRHCAWLAKLLLTI